MVEYLAFAEVDSDAWWYQSMCSLDDTIFGGGHSQQIGERLGMREQFYIQVAIADGEVVGYKIGYRDGKRRFYSWLGGVSTKYQRQGIASELMQRQHEWCQAQGYTSVQTKTKNTWRNMLILNLRHGFDVIGTYTDERGEPKIILEKRIAP